MSGSRSPWAWILGGCAVLAVAVGVAIVALAVIGWRTAKDFEATLRDPERRTDAVREVLGAEALPEGWRPVFAGSVPVLGGMAMLTSGRTVSTREGVEIGERGFVYVETIGSKADDVRKRFEEGGDLGDAFRGANLRFDLDREIARGTAAVDGGTLLWISGTGRVDVRGTGLDGLTTLAVIDCDADRRSRYAVWWSPVPDDPEALGGTIADGAWIEAFIRPFSACPR